MALIRLKNGIERLSDAKLLEYAGSVHERMTDNPHFTSPTPTLAELLTAITELNAAAIAALSGDRQLIAEKNDKRTSLVDLLHLMGYFVLYKSAGNRTIALSSGMPLAKVPAPQPELQKPTGLDVAVGSQPGLLLVKVKKVQGALAYIHQYSTDPQLKEESWKNHNCSTTKCKLSGLTPGTVYYIRVGAIGSKDQVMYSDVTSRMAA